MKPKNISARLTIYIVVFWIFFQVLSVSAKRPSDPSNLKPPSPIEATVHSENEHIQDMLFQRSGHLLQNISQITDELQRVITFANQLSNSFFWADKISRLQNADSSLLLSSLFLFIILLFLLYRLKHICHNFPALPFFSRRPILSISLDIILQSLPLFGSTLFFYFSSYSSSLSTALPQIHLAVDMMWALLIIGWWLDALSRIETVCSCSLLSLIRPRIFRLIHVLRYFLIAHFLASWFAGDSSSLLILARMLFGFVLIVWYYRLLQSVRDMPTSSATDPVIRSPIATRALLLTGYLIMGTGLVMDFIGYNKMAVYWFSSWGQTSAVLLWGGMFFLVLREWHQQSKHISKIENEGDKISGNPFRWFFLWACWLFWMGVFSIALIAAWGGKQTVIIGFLKTIHSPLKIGEMSFSLIGFVYAFLFLLLTHAASRLWRLFFQRKILSRSDIDVGLQESIVSIVVYAFWIFGILLALNAIGINTTSLAVGLGALGIGLGFGLQNIFNNFISGIILLFERPIQVGDAIEINGIWATVQKINVRSTVVQTLDNAAIIIPNSELISSQVINWSLKDMRLRRTIVVGVAYGSDTELVRTTLLEIAEKTAGVLKNPKPDVLFSDFGDSALIFKLRIFTLVEGMFTVETNLRFEIDRLFRERKITIAFPQRDIHIRSALKPEKKQRIRKNESS